MTSILERAIEHAKARHEMTAAEVNDLIQRDVDAPMTGNDFARLLASGAFRAAATAGVKREISGAPGARVHNVTLEDGYATEDFV